jgi:hypothetical protein
VASWDCGRILCAGHTLSSVRVQIGLQLRGGHGTELETRAEKKVKIRRQEKKKEKL